MNTFGFVAGFLQLAVDVLIVVGCVLAYRRFRLKSVPWLLAYFVLQQLLPGLTDLVVNNVVGRPMLRSGPIAMGMSAGELAILFTYGHTFAAAVAQALVAWFILAELSVAYTANLPEPAMPAAVSLPLRHSLAAGTVLLLAAIAMPVVWLWFAIVAA